ncbi:MAG: ComEA family DNA-binding protein [Chloroflexi bacterium]|nr:ComEA family DNA-binding protein [Chloroflexota bacterium]
MQSVLKVLAGVLAGFALAGVLIFISRSPTGNPVPLLPAPTEAPLVVQVVGAVPRPGVYEFPEGARIRDAIDAAGGLLTDADVEALNLASLLEDGQKLDIPFVGGPEGTPAPTALGPTATPSNADLININTATLEQLDSLPGIGPTTAQKIIDYRTANGPFARIEDIQNVSGIGPSTFEKLKLLITV